MGMPVTSPERTAFDLGRRAPMSDAVVALDALLAARVVTEQAVLRYASGRVGWPGSRQLRRALSLSDAKAESVMETRLRLVMVLGGLPAPTSQFVVRDADNSVVARLDFAYPWCRLGIEYDGDHHRSRAVFQHDLRRANRLRSLGWTLLRFGPRDVFDRPDETVRTIRTAMRRTVP
jgi:very-short-patch-repair endonuclease